MHYCTGDDGKLRYPAPTASTRCFSVKKHEVSPEPSDAPGRFRRNIRMLLVGSSYKGCVEKQDRHYAGNAPSYAHHCLSRRLIPTCFSTPKLRAATIGPPLHPSSTWLSTALPIPARGRIRRTATWRSTTHDHSFPIPYLTLPRTTRIPPLRQPVVPIPASAVTERGR